MKDEALKQNVTAANPQVPFSDMVQLYQNLYTVAQSNKNRNSTSYQGRRDTRQNNYSGGYNNRYHNSYAPRYHPYSQGQHPWYPNRPREGGRGNGGRYQGNGGRYQGHGGRQVARANAHFADEEPNPTQAEDQNTSSPPDLDTYHGDYAPYEPPYGDDSYYADEPPPQYPDQYYYDENEGHSPWFDDGPAYDY